PAVGTERVIRGGGANNPESAIATARRFALSPAIAGGFTVTSFRVVMAPQTVQFHRQTRPAAERIARRDSVTADPRLDSASSDTRARTPQIRPVIFAARSPINSLQVDCTLSGLTPSGAFKLYVRLVDANGSVTNGVSLNRADETGRSVIGSGSSTKPSTAEV